MNYTAKTKHKLDLIDQVLESIGQLPIADNSLILIDQELHFEHYIQFKIERNGLATMFIISDSGLTIYIDRAEEIYDFSNGSLEEDKNKVSDIVLAVLTLRMNIRYFGKHKTIIEILHDDNRVFATLQYWTGISLRWKPTMVKSVGPLF